MTVVVSDIVDRVGGVARSARNVSGVIRERPGAVADRAGEAAAEAVVDALPDVTGWAAWARRGFATYVVVGVGLTLVIVGLLMLTSSAWLPLVNPRNKVKAVGAIAKAVAKK